MKNLLNFLVFTLLLLQPSGAQQTAVPKFDIEKAKQDLKIYKEIVETAHSGIYLYTSKAEFDLLFSQAKTKVSLLNSFHEFYQLLAGLHSKINCGHSSFLASGNLFSEIKRESESKSEKAFFPFRVKFLKDTLVADQDYGLIKKGTQILSINGLTVADMTEEVFKLISSDGFNTTFKYRQMEEKFAIHFFSAFGASSRFEIAMIPYGKKIPQEAQLEGISIEEIDKVSYEAPFAVPYSLAYTDRNTALLTVNTFSTETQRGQKKFFKFLHHSFREMEEKNIQNLILDIRHNTGGDDGNDMELASYLIDTHFKENKFRKINSIEGMPPYVEYLSEFWFEMLDLNPNKRSKTKDHFKAMTEDDLEKGKDGAYYWKEKSIIHRDPAEYRFKGQAYVLIGGNVFSGGSLFSALVRDKSDAIFIGEETGGGYYRHTGTIPLIYELPHSGFLFSIFMVINEQDVTQKLLPNGSGTHPHHALYPTIQEYMAGKDVVMEKAKSLIKQRTP